MTITLAVTKREGQAAALRAEGKIPAVVYGPKQEPLAVAVDKSVFEKTLASAGESTIIKLTGLDHEIEALIHEVSFDAARGGVNHADFYAIERGKELTTHVALEFIGEAPVTKSGATVMKALHEIEITCRPSALPAHIEVDISGLVDDESHILVKDLVIPTGVKVVTDGDIAVVTVAAARKQEEDAVAASTETEEASEETKPEGE